jgi:predicted outer membrane repeat protein
VTKSNQAILATQLLLITKSTVQKSTQHSEQGRMEFRLAAVTFIILASLASCQLRHDRKWIGHSLQGRELANQSNKVDICHYDSNLRLFKKISISQNALKGHIGKHGPANGYKDMTVSDANDLVGSKNCECMSGFIGDGLSCQDIIDEPCKTVPTTPPEEFLSAIANANDQDNPAVICLTTGAVISLDDSQTVDLSNKYFTAICLKGERCTVTKSSTTSASRLFNHAAYGTTMKASFQNFIFSNGNALADFENGGAFNVLFGAGSIDFTSCDFINNNAKDGGAVFFEPRVSDFNASFTACTFKDNTAFYWGGASYFTHFNPNNYVLQAEVKDCSFLNNIAGQFGGGILAQSSYVNLIITRTEFTDNMGSEGKDIYSDNSATVSCNDGTNTITGTYPSNLCTPP